MNVLRCLVVDDEPLAAKLISTYVERTPFLELVAEVHSAEAALAELSRSDASVDLIFLDIHMPRLSGMQLARLVPQGVRVVFTTAYADHAVEGFRVNALDYLLKPVSYDEFLEAATRALSSAEARPADTASPAAPPDSSKYILVKSEYRLLRIPVADIVYVEGLKDYVKIYIDGGPDTRPVMTLMSMKSLEESLPQPGFVRVHRSFIVNMDKVRLVERNNIILAGRCIPVSDSYRHRFFEVLGGM